MPDGFVLTSQEASCDSGCAVRRTYRVSLPYVEAVRAGTAALREAGLETTKAEAADADIDGRPLSGGRTGRVVPVAGDHRVGYVLGGLTVIKEPGGRVTAEVGLATWTLARHVQELTAALDELRLDRLGPTETRQHGASACFSDCLAIIREVKTELTRDERFARVVAELRRAGYTLSGRTCYPKSAARMEGWTRDGVLIDVSTEESKVDKGEIRVSASHGTDPGLGMC